MGFCIASLMPAKRSAVASRPSTDHWLPNGIFEFFRRFSVATGLSPVAARVGLLVLVGFGTVCGTLRGAEGRDEEEVPGVKLIDPRSYGFRAPPGEISVPADERVLTEYLGEVVVGHVHVRVGENLIVLMPDGVLEDRRPSEVQSTDRPFEPIDPQALADRLRTGPLDRFKVKKSKHHLFVYNAPEDYVDATRRILDSMDRGLANFTRKLGCEPSEPMVPMVVVIFATEKEFQAYKSMPPQVVAYYNVVTNQIVLHAELPLLNTRPDLALGQALSTIAHEGTHQILHNIGIQQRLAVWPMWLGEGLAEYLAPTSFGNNFRWKGAGEVNDLRMFELETYIQNRSFKGLDGATIQQAIEGQQLTSTGYATAWAITHYLVEKQNDQFQQYMKLLHKIKPLQGMAARAGQPVIENREHFQKYFGDDFAAIELALVRHLEKQPYTSPVAALPHYVALIQYPEGDKNIRRGGFFYQRQDADLWLQGYMEELGEAARSQAQCEIEEYRNRGDANRRLSAWTK